MAIPYKNPITPLEIQGGLSINPSLTFGNTFSVYNVGGYMEVGSISDLIYTIPTGTTGSIEYSGNTIPIEFTKGTGTVWSPDVLTLYSDNISSGRRKIGMLVYVREESQIYQYDINNYDTLWNSATASTGTVSVSDFGTTVNNSTVAGQNFINAWTGSTIEGVSGNTRATSVWKKFYYLSLSGGTVNGHTTFKSGITTNYINFETNPVVPSPTGGTLYFDSTENALSYKPITPSNDVTVNLGQEGLIRIYNDLGFQINNGQALHITGATSGTATVCLAIGTGGDAVQFQVSGIATHDIPNSSFGFMTQFGVVRDVNLTGFTVGQQIYLSQTVPGGLSSYSGLSFTGRTCEIGHVLDNSALGKLQVTILNEIEGTIITTQENNILAANNSSNGVFQFSGLTIDTPSGTTFSVGAVEGWIIDNVTSPANPTIQLIIYPGSSGNSATYVTSATETYILLTSGLTIVQQTTFPTPQQRRQNLYLGKFGHANKQFLINAFNEPDSSLSPLAQLRDMFTPIKLINEGIYPSANGANLNINTSAGVLYGLGIGYITNKLNPNSLSVSGTNPCTFQYRTQTGGTASNTTLITPGVYDNNGVVTAVGGGSNSSTNQRIYLVQNGQFRIQYGQQVYGSLAAAIEASQNETFTTFSNFRDNAILIGILSVNKNATDLSDTTQARFLLTSKFGETIGAAGGLSTTNLQQAYNNSSDPEILINSTLDGLSIRNGTGNADNVTSLLQGQNTAGTVTSFIRADGAILGTSISATTISATTYQNLPLRVSGTGTQDYVTKWDSSTVGLVDGQIYDTGAFIGIATTSPQYGETFSIQTSNKGITIDGLYIRDAGGSLAFGTNFDYSTWGSSGGEIAIGTRGVLSNSTGTGNIGIGDKALENNLTGNGNIAIGATGALFNNITGSSNIAIGQNAMLSNTEGQYNVAIGEDSLFTNIDGNNNTVLGYGAGYSNLGKDNVYIGYSAGYNNSGNGNIFIGNAAGYGDTSSSGKLDIGGIIFGNLSSGFIGIGQSTPLYNLDVVGNSKITNTKGSVITDGNTSTAFMTFSGSGTIGGVGYNDFIRVTNTAVGATAPTKTFRVNNTGGFEIINNAYTNQILSLTDNGIIAVGGGNAATSTSQDATSNYLTFNNNNSQIYDDGNFHIHSRGVNQAMWINSNNGQINIGAQSPTSTGNIASAIAFATGTVNGYVTINTGRTVTTSVAYGYLTTAGAGTYPGGSQTISISLYANNRIWGQEIDAFSDERMKNIEGEISLEDGIKLVSNLKPIKYTWKEGDDRGIKAGYSAQQVIKSGFDHLIGLIPTEGLEETIDEDGFLSPKDTQFAMNYDQVTPYHGVVIKHLLEKIEQLENRIKDLENK